MSWQRSNALSLYRRCLRTANRCPASNQQKIWADYTRIKFREGRMLSKRDQVAIKRCVGDAVEQVERLEYYQRAAGLLPTLETSKEVCNETQTSLQAQTTFCEKHGVLTSFLGTLRIDGCVTSVCKTLIIMSFLFSFILQTTFLRFFVRCDVSDRTWL